MLDSDLAQLYGVETKFLKRAVRRNLVRFPDDFFFEMTKEELSNWRYQFGTSNRENMGLRIPPFVFTELGIAMLSTVLSSDKAISINISIMRIFVKLRNSLVPESSLATRMGELEMGTNQMFKVVFERLDDLEQSIPSGLKPNRSKIGLKTS